MLSETCASFVFICAFICVEFGCCIAVNAERERERERSKQVRYRLGSRTTYRIRPKSNRSKNPVQCYLHWTLCISTCFNRPCRKCKHDTYFKIQVYEFSGSSLSFLSGSRQCQYRISRPNSWLNTNQRAPSRCTEHSKKLRYSLCSQEEVVLKELELAGLLKHDIYMSWGAECSRDLCDVLSTVVLCGGETGQQGMEKTA